MRPVPQIQNPQRREADREIESSEGHGVIRPAGKIKSPGFPKIEKPKKAVVYRPVTFYREDTP